jgi:hypothetical protein
MRSTPTMQGTTSGRFVHVALSLVLAVAPMSAHAHGDHGSGGHDGWTLDHAHFEHWGIAEWGMAALLVIAISACSAWARRAA